LKPSRRYRITADDKDGSIPCTPCVAILSGRKGLRAIARYEQDYPEVLETVLKPSRKPIF